MKEYNYGECKQWRYFMMLYFPEQFAFSELEDKIKAVILVLIHSVSLVYT